jgi:hypothetical protein
MRKMRLGVWGRVIIAVVFVCFVCACAGLMNTALVAPKKWVGSTLVYQKDVWKLDIKYLKKGTKNEGQDGVLYKSGKAVKAKQVDEVIETSIGTLKYYGKRTSVNNPWAVTGWNFAGGAINSHDVKFK